MFGSLVQGHQFSKRSQFYLKKYKRNHQTLFVQKYSRPPAIYLLIELHNPTQSQFKTLKMHCGRSLEFHSLLAVRNRNPYLYKAASEFRMLSAKIPHPHLSFSLKDTNEKIQNLFPQPAWPSNSNLEGIKKITLPREPGESKARSNS